MATGKQWGAWQTHWKPGRSETSAGSITLFLHVDWPFCEWNSHFYIFHNSKTSQPSLNQYRTDEKSSLHNWRGAWAPFRSAQLLSAMNIFESQIFRKRLFLNWKISSDETELSFFHIIWITKMNFMIMIRKTRLSKLRLLGSKLKLD